jgi:hypothetical protein
VATAPTLTPMGDEFELHEILLRCRRMEKKIDALLADDSVVSKSTQQNDKSMCWWQRRRRKRVRSHNGEVVA